MKILFAHVITTSTAQASSVSPSGYTNTRESLGELEKAVESLACAQGALTSVLECE